MILKCSANPLPHIKQGFQLQGEPQTDKSVFCTLLCSKLAFSSLENYFSHPPWIQLSWTPATQQEPTTGQTKLRLWLPVALRNQLRGCDWSLWLGSSSLCPHKEKDLLCSGCLPCLIDTLWHWAGVSEGQQAHFPVKKKICTYLCLLKALMDFSWPSPTEDDQSSATALPTQQGTSGVHLCETTIWRDEVEPALQSCH